MKNLKLISLFVVTALLVSMVSVIPAGAVSGASAYVNTESLNIRKGASTSSAIIDTLKKKTTLTILSPRKYNTNWYKVQLKSGKKGYAHKSYLKVKSNQLLIPSSGTGYNGYNVTVKNIINTTGKSISWTSSDKSVAEVNSSGKITCHKNGTVKITAKANSKASTCKITVKTAEVKFSKDNYTMYTGDLGVIAAKCPKSVTYKSSDKSIAEVNSSNGGVNPKKEGKVKITATSKSGSSDSYTLTVKKRVISASLSDTTIYKGCRAIMKATGASAISFKSSNTKIATVSSKGIITGKAAGTAKITASTSDASLTKSIKVKSGSSVNISLDSDSVRKNMTLLIKSKTSGVKWKSTDTSVATVKKGYVLGKKQGTTIIRAYTSKGANDCVVKVKAAEPVRYVYTSENSVLLNHTVKIYAITDNTRTGVKFKITDPSGKSSWLTNPKKSKDGSRFLWAVSKKVTKHGFYKINAYAHTSSNKEWKNTSGGDGRFFVTKTESRTSCYKGNRLVTTKILKHIAEYEGYASSVYDDPLVVDTPTVGYGKVVYSGSKFYNNMTKKEAFADMTQDINDSAYTTRVSKILADHKISYNQNHFDALVDFSYNLGVYCITNNSELLSTLTKTYGKASYKNTGYINKTSVALRKSASGSAKNLKNIKAGTIVTLVSTKVHNSNWYHVKLSNGTKGYIKTNQITRRSTDTSVRNLKNVPVKTYAKNFLKFHHASGICYKGLLYRRIDELEIFFFNEYDNDGRNNSYGISFTCPYNSGFHAP